MVQRRQLIGAGLLGGIASLATAPAADAGQTQVSERSLDDLRRSVDGIQHEMESQWGFDEIQAVRSAQIGHLRTFSKLPDYIDVGTDAFFRAHDWHIRWQQPLELGRDLQGRYTLVLLQTLLILRTDQSQNYVGIPYDSNQR